MPTFEEKLRSLPLEIQDAITSPEFGEKVDAIGEKHNLHIDQVGELVNEVGLVLLGETKSSDFAANIEKSLNIAAAEANTITEDINTDIFLPLQDVLQGTAEEKPSVHLETPDEILKHIEDGGLELPAPEIAPEPTPTPVSAPAPSEPTPDLTEHLLQNTVASPHVEETKVEKKYTVDPYREPIA